jgi:hypothetical protein
MDSVKLELRRTYFIKHTTHMVKGVVEEVTYRLDPEDLHRKSADTLQLNEIGRVSIRLMKAIYADTYEHNRHTGCFIIIDPITNHTVGAGMIIRCQCMDQSHFVKSVAVVQTYWYVRQTEAARKEFEKITHEGQACIYLDDKLLSRGICSDLTGLEKIESWFSRIAHICKVANDSGVSVVIESDRSPNDMVRSIIGEKKLAVAEN